MYFPWSYQMHTLHHFQAISGGNLKGYHDQSESQTLRWFITRLLLSHCPTLYSVACNSHGERSREKIPRIAENRKLIKSWQQPIWLQYRLLISFLDPVISQIQPKVSFAIMTSPQIIAIISTIAIIHRRLGDGVSLKF